MSPDGAANVVIDEVGQGAVQILAHQSVELLLHVAKAVRPHRRFAEVE